MYKKFLSLIIAGVMLFGVSAFAEEEEKLISPAPRAISLTIGEKQLVADDMVIELDVAPCIINDRTMVPMRAVFEALGAAVEWDGETRTIYAVRNEIVIAMQVGQDSIFVNSLRVPIDAPSVIVEDRTMIPFRAIAESFGYTVDYDEETKTVTITE